MRSLYRPLGHLVFDSSEPLVRPPLASLYETLYRLEERGHLHGRWVEKPGTRRRRSYRITEGGRKVLAAQRRDWGLFIAALSRVAGLETA
jgi:DNA-binding PadR family transcriptional regulator